jgi:hypothetical protein
VSPEGLSKRRWKWMKLTHPHASDFWLYYPNGDPGGHRVLRVCDRSGYDFAILVWHVCEECRHGLIAKISIADYRQRQGIGRRMVLRALLGHEDYQWVTTGQSDLAQGFFPVLTAETGAAFTARGESCEHIRSSRRGLPRPRLEYANTPLGYREQE